MRRSSSPAFWTASAREEKARLPSSISLFASAVMTAGVPWKRIGSQKEGFAVFFIKSGFSGSNGVQSDGATIQLARILTASAPCAAAPANSRTKPNTHRNVRILPPWWFSSRSLRATISPRARGGHGSEECANPKLACRERLRTSELDHELRPHESYFICLLPRFTCPTAERKTWSAGLPPATTRS